MDNSVRMALLEDDALATINDDEPTLRKPFLEDQGAVLTSIYNETDWPCPSQRFLYKFPISLERLLQPFDDKVMKFCQRVEGNIWVYIDLILTGMVAIETGIAAPFVFFILGWDGLAIEMSYLMLALSLFSQIPKRFLWRYRPYMVQRAKKMRNRESATTSSFPSRAVTCATVYSFVISYAYMYMYKNAVVVSWWMPLLAIFAVILSSFARVHMGVHYPSDCVIGLIQGILVCIFGTLLWHANTIGCASCFTDNCYSLPTTPEGLTKENLKNFNFYSLIVSSVVALVITAVSVVKPIDFWDKCDRVYGMLLPGVVFQITFLCPSTMHSSLPHPKEAPWYAYLFGITIAALATAFAYKNKGRKPVLSFSCLFLVLYCTLALWRLWVL